MRARLIEGLLLLGFATAEMPSPLAAQVVTAQDGPKPRSPDASAASFNLPPGFRMELVASEPLITEPSGVCWDEHGRLYVSELHGYNLEGQFDIDELNRTGQLDQVVRRIQANEAAKAAALAGTYGVVKLLHDDNGDGRMDRASVFADGLPPCYGLVAARGGVIVACAPDIVYLADRDGDGHAEVREALFTGFPVGALERGINAPQWGPDNWIYFGSGHGGGRITGPHLREPVELGGNNFRIRADGSAIENVTGDTHTFGHAFTPDGDHFVITTSIPGIQVAPLPWRYLTRNPDAALPGLQRNAADYTRVFPAAPPHPWRTRRADDPGFFKYYRDRYGASDSDAGGYFTSACSPLVYDDPALPAEYRGSYFVCEPAQNLIHRAQIAVEGTALILQRPAGEATREFLASTDQWFHPMNLAVGPDGAIYITDFYREIIEDYSAIPRYLQQQYGLTNGLNHGRIWRLTHESAPRAPSPDLASLTGEQLAAEIASPYSWRRETARRLVVEQQLSGIRRIWDPLLRDPATPPRAVVNILHTLDGLNALGTRHFAAAWFQHEHWAVRREVLRIADQYFWDDIATFIQEWMFVPANLQGEPRLLLQLALSLGESPATVTGLAQLAREHGDLRWMDAAILSSAERQEYVLLYTLLPDPGKSAGWLDALAAAIASRADEPEVRATLALVKSQPASERNSQLARTLEAGLPENQQALVAGKMEPPQPPDAATLAEIEQQLPTFIRALSAPRNRDRGRELFREHCSACHVAKGIGTAVGPPLDAEFQRAEETIVRDILFPHETITAGYEACQLELRRGDDVVGLRVAESPTSVTLRFVGGTEATVLRKRIERVHLHKLSLMPAGFGQVLKPDEVADVIAFLRERQP